MELQSRIAQNREHTKALLTRRLLQSHRQHKALADKVIAQRRAIRLLRNTAIAVPTALAMMWFAMTLLGLGITRLDANPRAAVTRAPQPVPATTAAPETPSNGSSAVAEGPPVVAGEQSSLRFEINLSAPKTQSTPEI